jgi:aminomethyltransferase
MIPTMWAWFEQNLPSDGSVIIEDLSDATAILALQGPNAMQIVRDVLGTDNEVGRFRCQAIRENPLGMTGWIQGTGYTGESGVEIFVSNEDVRQLWDAILDHTDSGVVPVGLGARDTLRMEMGYLLSGQDFCWPGLSVDDDGSERNQNAIGDEQTLSRDTAETFVPFGLDIEHEFIGRSRVLASRAAQANGTAPRWLGIRYLEKGPFPRPGHMVLKVDGPNRSLPEGEGLVEEDDSETILGYITSGGPAPSLERVGIGLAYLLGIEIGDEVLIAPNPRKRVRAIVVRPPFI